MILRVLKFVSLPRGKTSTSLFLQNQHQLRALGVMAQYIDGDDKVDIVSELSEFPGLQV